MAEPRLRRFLASPAAATLPPGCLAVVIDDGLSRTAETVRHLAALGAAATIVLGRGDDVAEPHTIRLDVPTGRESIAAHLNAIAARYPSRWIVWCWAGEYLFFPYCETRTIDDLTDFLGEERRRVLYTYALDLYTPDGSLPDGTVRAASTMFDRLGYHAFWEAENRLRLYGSLGWRFEALIADDDRQIGRPALFKASRDARMNAALTFDDADYASVQCAWHHNPTGALMSLRRAAMLDRQPAFDGLRDRLVWHGSEPFTWSSQQLLDLGMIETGQWF